MMASHSINTKQRAGEVRAERPGLVTAVRAAHCASKWAKRGLLGILVEESGVQVFLQSSGKVLPKPASPTSSLSCSGSVQNTQKGWGFLGDGTQQRACVPPCAPRWGMNPQVPFHPSPATADSA